MDSKLVVTAFGEILERDTVYNAKSLKDIDFNETNYEKSFGGTEANTLIALSNLGVDTRYITAVPKNSSGESALSFLNSMNVDTSYIKFYGDKLGKYYVLPEVLNRDEGTLFDRDGSSVTKINADEFDFDKVFENAGIFQISGVAFSLKNNMTKNAFKFLEEAKKRNIVRSFDFNYRPGLWNNDIQSAKKMFKKVMPYTDIIFVSDLDLKTFLDCKGNSTKELVDDFYKKYNTAYVVVRNRKNLTNSLSRVTAGIYTKNGGYQMKAPRYFEIKEKIGGGDTFDAGILYGILNNMSLENIIDYGITCFVLKHQIKGDIFLCDKQTVEKNLHFVQSKDDPLVKLGHKLENQEELEIEK